MIRLAPKHPLARRRAPAAILVLSLAAAGASGLLAQATAPPSGASQPLNGLDFSGLTPEQTAAATQILNEAHCNCGCSPPMTLSECRVKDPGCSRSLSLARGVIQDFKDGKSAAVAKTNLQAALAKAAAPPPAPPAVDPNKVFSIDTTGDPVKGPKSAPVTIVEFSDYQ